jgi:ATP-dependent Clp protease ATP-binding subunit ClpA
LRLTGSPIIIEVGFRSHAAQGLRFMSAPDGSMEDIFMPGGRLRVDLLDHAAAEAVNESLRLARETRWDSVRSPHVFMGILAVPDERVRNWGERLGADLPKLLGQFQELFHQEEGEREAILVLNREFLSDNVLRLLREAYHRAVENQRSQITTMDLLISLLTAPNSIVAECFERIGLTAARLTELAVIAEQQGGQP